MRELLGNVFGYYLVQVGDPGWRDAALRDCRVRRKFVLDTTDTAPAAGADYERAAVRDSEWPLRADSIDAVVLPHTLDFSDSPHQVLREAERVLVPDGRLLITGFNPASLWGLRQRAGQARLRMGLRRGRAPLMPSAGEFIGYWRLRDWLRLLGFEVEAGRFGCWRPPCRSERWLQRFGWMEPLGSHWWPVLGAVYEIAAVKRVRGMRLVGLARRERKTARQGRAVVAQRRRETADAIAETSPE